MADEDIQVPLPPAAAGPSIGKFASTFEAFGIELGDGPGNERVGDCPFCGKVDHFYVNTVTGQFACHAGGCDRTGNIFGFLDDVCRHWAGHTTDDQWRGLEDDRRLPRTAFDPWHVGFCRTTGEWLIPSYSDKGTVRDVRRYNPRNNRTMATANCTTQLLGVYGLAHHSAPAKVRVWLCEGDWDVIALRWLFDLVGGRYRSDIVVGVPGAGAFKREWCEWFRGAEVISCYDNDEAGDKGAQKSAGALDGYARNVSFVCWPESLKVGYDIRDLITEALGASENFDPLQVVNQLEKLVRPTQRRQTIAEPPSQAIAPQNGQSVKKQTFALADLMAVFAQWVQMTPEMVLGIKVALATAVSFEYPGDPLWLYLVGPPSSGKTLILSSLKRWDGCVFASTLTPASLISGYDKGPDHSLLPKLDKRCAVFKDWTEILIMDPKAKAAIDGTLRGAFDGSASKWFGNIGTRSYTSKFNILAGVTGAIHADNSSHLGSRFLKCELHTTETERHDRMVQVASEFRDLDRMARREEALADATATFCSAIVNPAKVPFVPDHYTERLIAMAEVTSMLRANVERHTTYGQYGDDPKYRPAPEHATRVFKQFLKLAMGLATIHGRAEAIEEDIQTVWRVSRDTCVGFNVDIITAMLALGPDGNPVAPGDIAVTAKMAIGSVRRRLNDLEALEIIRKVPMAEGGKGVVPMGFVVSEKAVQLWSDGGKNL